MSNQSYGAQMQQIAADQEMRTKYFDIDAAAIGQRVPYRDDDDATDDRAWDDAESRLRQRGMKLHDDGSGYRIVGLDDAR